MDTGLISFSNHKFGEMVENHSQQSTNITITQRFSKRKEAFYMRKKYNTNNRIICMYIST